MVMDYDQQYTGVVDQIGIFPINEKIKNQRVQSGEHKGEQFNIDKTHSVAFKIPSLHDKWIGIGHRKFREGYDLIFQIKKGEKYVDIWNGSTLTFMYAVSYADNGQKYINIEAKSIRAMKLAECDQKVYSFGTKKEGGGESTGSPAPAYNAVGALQGNAFNGSMILLKDKFDSPKLIETAMALKVINEEIKALLPNVNGASIGMAILAGCKAGKKIGAVKDIAVTILKTQIPALEQAWDGKPESQDQGEPEPDSSGIDEDDIPF